VAPGTKEKNLSQSLKKYLSTRNSRDARELLESKKSFHGVNRQYMNENRNYQSGTMLHLANGNAQSPHLSPSRFRNRSQDVLE